MNTDSVRLVSNGQYWKATWRDSSGKRQEKSLGSKKKLTKGGAVHLCRDIAREHAIAPGRKDVRISPTLGQWRTIFIKQRSHAHSATIDLFEQTFDLLVLHFDESTRIDKITRAEAARWRSELATRKVPHTDRLITETTVAKHTGNAKAIFGEAARQDLIAFNPFDALSSTRPEVEKDWHHFTDSDMDKLFAACDSVFQRAGIALCRYAGLRPNEMVRVTPADIDWTGKTITVRAARKMNARAGKVTTKQKARMVPIEPRLYVILREAYEAMPAGAVTFWQESTNCPKIVRMLHRCIKRAGLVPVAEPWKTMRKNCETDWQSHNPPLPPLDVAAWLGHNVAVSAKHYHRTKSESIERVTGQGADISSEIARLEAELAELRARRENPAKI